MAKDTFTRADLRENLIGVYELVRIMGVSKGRISQYTNAEWFPEPIATPGMGRLWYKPDVITAWDTHKASIARHRPPADYATGLDETS